MNGIARAQVFQGPKRGFTLQGVMIPENLAPGEVLVQVLLSTLSANDLASIHGLTNSPVPAILGHEGVGQILSSARDGFQAGERVVWSACDSCGECAACTEYGLPQKCSSLFRYGNVSFHDGSALNGTHCTHVVLRPGTTIVPVPAALPDAVVAPANGALATMIQALRGLPKPKRVLVQGCGLAGLFAVALLRHQGAESVFAADRDAKRREASRAFGATPLAIRLPPGSVDLVVETLGDPVLLDDGLESLRPGGSYVWTGMVHSDTNTNLTGDVVVKKCLTVRGAHFSTPADLQAAVRFLSLTHHRLPYHTLAGEPHPLDRFDDAIAETGRRHHPLTLLDPNQEVQAVNLEARVAETP